VIYVAAEIVFSAVERISGEHLAATKKANMMQEVITEIVLYQLRD
jgi:hypothetical protein